VALPIDARFCPACGVPATDGPERRLVTALFCDVVGSTPLAERLDPEVLRGVMREYAAMARRAIERNGGTVASFQGDGVVALFGLPVAHEDDAARAARAGLELRAALPDAKEAAIQGVVLEARVGIESGEVLGDLATAASGALASDVLNTAARLQGFTEPGTVLAGEGTLRLLRDHAQVRSLPRITLKGKAEPVSAAIVLSVDAGPRRPSASEFVGRERLLASLARALEEAIAEGAPVLATVLGDPGIGKSRLVDAFIRGTAGVTVLQTSVPAEGEGVSLAPIADVVRAASGGGGTADAAMGLGRLLAGRPDAEALEASLLSLIGIGDQTAADHTWAVRRLLETLAADQPVVLALDDVHWAGPALLELVEDIARWTRGSVLILCAARMDLLDVRRSWGGGMARAVTLTVGPLAVAESKELADALLGSGTVDADRLVATAEGNPLFLEQLAAEALELGEAWDPATAPTTIRALLEARLDRCSPEVARVLAVASVQGSRFRLDVTRGLADGDVDLGIALREAERAQLAKEVGPNDGAFVHALVRETVYRRLPKATRADIHARVAELLAGDDELAGIHLERAAALRAELGHRDLDLERRAGERLALIGERAFARLDLVTSSDLLERAARLLPHGASVRVEMLPDLCVAMMENGREEEARALLAGAVEEAEEAGSRRDAIRIRLQQLALLVFSSSTDAQVRPGIAEGRVLLEELAGLGDDVGLAQGWVVMDYLHWLIGEMANAHDAAGRSVEHARRAGRLREQVQAGGDEASVLALGPLPLAEMRVVAERRRGDANPIVAAGGLAGISVCAVLSGDIDGYVQAEGAWRRAVSAGGLEWTGAEHAVAAMVPALIEAGEPERAEALVREGLATMERLGDVWVLNGASFFLPLALSRQGRGDEAAVLAEALDERYVWMGRPDGVTRAIALSAARAVRGRSEDALSLAMEGADIARSSDSTLLKTLALEHLAERLYETDPAAAIATLEETAALDSFAGYVPSLRRVAGTLDRWRS